MTTNSRYNPRFTPDAPPGWAIICDARQGAGLGVSHLILVDQHLDSSTWWTSDDPTIAMCYRSRRVADEACARFKRNNPRVIGYDEAMALLAHQNRQIAMHTLEKVNA